MIKRLDRPEEVAAMLAFFFSADGFCTGMSFPVDGGWSVNGRNI